MAFYSYMFTANYKRFFTKLKAVAKRDNRNFLGLVLDTGWSIVHYGLALTDYLTYEIYRRSKDERKEYVGVRMQNTFYEQVSPSAYKALFSEKPVFLREFAEYTNRSFLVPQADNYEAFQAFLNTQDVIMAKPYDGVGGHGVEKVYTKDIEDPKAYFDHCIKNRIYLEELVHQHPQMNVLCPASVNTMRIMTYYDHGNPRILWMGLRIGDGIHPVDNFHAHGMVVGIDQATGKLTGSAINTDNEVFTHHPTTGVQIDGFQIPCFEEAKALVLKAARKSDKILVVGWDVAISENGPVLIEGNRRPGFVLPQMVDSCGRMDIVRDVFSSLNIPL